MSKFESARLKYKPNNIKTLLIAETPPKSNSNRYFYFEDETIYDSLFSETMKILYPYNSLQSLGKDKISLLKQFQKDGYFLIDSLEKPFEENYSPSKKIKMIKDGQEDLLKHIQSIKNENTKVVLTQILH